MIKKYYKNTDAKSGKIEKMGFRGKRLSFWASAVVVVYFS